MADADRPQPAPSLLSPFAIRLFLTIWLANLVSSFGTQIQMVGASWSMTELTRSPQMVALVSTVWLLPILLFSLPFGAAADLFDRRKLLIGAQLVMFGASVVLALIAFAGLVTPSLLLLLTFVLGCGLALNIPTWQAMVGEVVPVDQLPPAVLLNTIAHNLSRTLAPALGGLIIAFGGPQAAFTINALTCLALPAVLLPWRRTAQASAVGRESIGAAMINGLQYVFNSRGVGRIILRGSLFGICFSPLLALQPMVVTELLGGDARLYGIMLGCTGVGAVAGAILGERLRRRSDAEAVLRVALGATWAALLVTSVSRSPLLTGLAQLLTGAGMVMALASFNITMQLSVPRWITGRAMSVLQMGSIGGIAIGALIWGAVAEQAGVAITLQMAAAALAASFLFGLRLPLLESDPAIHQPGRRQFSRDLPISDATSGRVSVLREFRIGAADEQEFLELMRERRRILRRHGVRRWALARDADHPELWIEQYQRSGWNDYLRVRERMTVEEEHNLERLAALHQGAGWPPMRFLVERDVTAANPAAPQPPLTP